MTAMPPDSPAADELIGTLLGQRFRIEALLGTGGMAQVYRALDQTSGKRVAVKLLKDAIADNTEAVARLRREAELLSRFVHPAIVRIDHVGRLPDGRIYLVMEYLLGETLGARMRARRRLSQDELTPILAGAVAGLQVAHEAGVVHRDLKPDNIFLQTPEGGGEQVKLLDFGISKHIGQERLTRTGQVLGTPRYMAPEQLTADKDLDVRVDTYALGVILYEALSGNPPFVGVSPSELVQAILRGRVTPIRNHVPNLAPELDVVVHRAMARAKAARYDSARALFDAWLEASGQQGAARSGDGAAPTNVLGRMGYMDEGHDRSQRSNVSEPPASFSDFVSGGATKPDATPEQPRARGAAADEPTRAAGTGTDNASARRPRDRPKAETGTRSPRSSEAQASKAARATKNRRRLLALLSLALLAGACTAGTFVLGFRQLHPARQTAPVPITAPTETVAANPQPARAGDLPGTPESLYADALAAQQRGDALVCTQLVDAAIRAGGSALYYRTEGECYDMLGDRLNALKAYERYCAAAPPTDPARARVQETVRAAHGRCD